MPDALSRAKLARAAFSLNPGGLILMTDDVRLADPLAAARALPPGSMVIVRSKDASRRAKLAAQLRLIAFAQGLLLLIADDPALARAIGANGIHLPAARARDAAHWRSRNPGWLITASAHSLSGLLRASQADAVLLSPVFASQSHVGGKYLSPARARAMARRAPLPVFALGGVTARNVSLLAGFSGVAAIGALI